MNLDQKFPCVSDMETACRRRIPKFAFDFLIGGIDNDLCIDENRSALDRIKLRPRYISGNEVSPDCSHGLFGKTYDAPFGVAPMGLGGLMWPRAHEHTARAAKDHNLPFILSSFATSSIEEIAMTAGACTWFQLSMTSDDEANRDLVKRALDAGAEMLVVTVDIPVETRRRRDIKNGLTVPLRLGLNTVYQVATRPRWAFATAIAGIPRFKNLAPYVSDEGSLETKGHYTSGLVEIRVSVDRLKWARDIWPGNLVVKGLLDPEDAKLSKGIGVDGIVISNHGGRQLDAAETAPGMLPIMREAVGPDFPLMVDGGVRSGLDIARMIASGADFVFIGRPFMFALGAMGPKGADHVMFVLKSELQSTLGQIGCPRVSDLPKFLA